MRFQSRNFRIDLPAQRPTKDAEGDGGEGEDFMTGELTET